MSLRIPLPARAVCLLLAAPLFIALAGCRPHDFPQYPPNYREYAYVTNRDSNTVTVLDVVNVRLDRELPVGLNPVAVAASPVRNEVYVVNAGNAVVPGSLSVINSENNSVTATVSLHKRAASIDVDTTGKTAYVANSGSNTISVVDLAVRREVAVIGTGEEPVQAKIAPDGNSVVVSNRGGNSVSLIDPVVRRVRAFFEGCPGASDVVILRDSSKAFVACGGGHQVMVIALARPNARPAQPDRLETLMDVGRAPVQLALKPDGGEIFVSNSQSNSVSEIYAGTDEAAGATMMGDNPVHGLVSRDNSLLYVSNLRSQELTIYAIDDGKRAGFIRVGDGPSAMAFSAAGNLLFVVDARSADVAVVRTASQSLFTMLPAGRAPNAIAIKSFKLP